MKLNKPQVQLFRELVVEEDLSEHTDYYLHAVTFCERADLKAAGHALNPEKPVLDKTLKINLFIQEAPELPRLFSLTPIVHTISLGALPFDGDGTIETQVLLLPANETIENAANLVKGGANTSSTTSADEVDRPLDEFYAGSE